MVTYFISDLHLSAKRPATSALFLKFLALEAKNADALYILGDLFESWVGDDNHNTHDEEIIEGLAKLARSGIPLYFMHGNRDFLIGDQFVARTHCTLLPDPSVVHLYQKKILLTHGDQLCTLDKKYQRFRRIVRHPFSQKFFLKLPLGLRRTIAKILRTKSSEHLQTIKNGRRAVFNTPQDVPVGRAPGWRESQSQPERQKIHQRMIYTWDVVLDTIYKFLREHQVYTLIHGHTHKPGLHHFILDNHKAVRIVLGEWDNHGSVLVYSPTSTEFKTFI